MMQNDAKIHVKHEGIAIVGMAGKFPGANNINILWDNLLSKKVNITRFTDHEHNNLLTALKNKNDSLIGARGIIDDIEYFDYLFFKISKMEAELTDPQHRVFLENCWEALEDAGYPPDQIKLKVGVFASTCVSTYLFNNLLVDGKLKNDFANIAIINNSPDSLATRVSYKLNLNGPSKTIQTFCSSSLVAVHDAIQSIKNSECEMAIVGGVNIVIPQLSGYIYSESSIYSPTGNIRPFDETADGTVFSNGVGVVILKKLTKAIDDYDHIYGVIIGSSINNDGAEKASYFSPSIKGQIECITKVYEDSCINPDTISYIETHGTATKIGDPLEIHALKQAVEKFTNKKNYCAIGSIKGNIGHLDRAAGIAALIKCSLITTHHKIPPIAYLENINKDINLSGSPFFINKDEIHIFNETPIRVALSSMGVGGTNAHLVVEEAPVGYMNNCNKRINHIIKISAKNHQSLLNNIVNLKSYLMRNYDISIARLAYTLQVGRNDFNDRIFILAKTIGDLIQGLQIKMSAHTLSFEHKDIEKVNIIVDEDLDAYFDCLQYLLKHEPLFKKFFLECEFIDTISDYDKSCCDTMYSSLFNLLSRNNPIIYVEKTFKKYLNEIITCASEIKILSNVKKSTVITADNNEVYIVLGKVDDHSVDGPNIFYINNSAPEVFYEMIGYLWCNGMTISWDKFNFDNRVNKISLPTYGFTKEKCWINAARVSSDIEKNKLELQFCTEEDALNIMQQQVVSFERQCLDQLDLI